MNLRCAHSADELVRIRDSVAIVGRLSDSLVRFGPFRLGVDGVLSWIPGVGEAYSMIAGAYIIVQGLRAGVPPHILLLCAALMASRTTVSAIPFAGPIAADLFTAHRWSAKLVVRAIDDRLPNWAKSPGSPVLATV
ncbi:MAG: DUF4112 domain-containing protein [Caulobacteraceae bacterium]